MADTPPGEHSIRWLGDNLACVAAFMHPTAAAVTHDRQIRITTPDGPQHVNVGDWIIRTGDTLTIQHAEESMR